MRAFVTLTGNLLAERTLEFDEGWHPGATQRARRESFQVGGKGFNVAKMLHRLGAAVTAVGFAGGPAGAECREWLAHHAGYRWRLIPTNAATRTGMVLRAPRQPETTLLAPDRAVDAAALDQCAELLNTLPNETAVALCGSFPGWSDAPAHGLRAALHRLAQAGRLAVDCYGPPLEELVRLPVPLVKINRQEFSRLFPASSAPLGDQLQTALGRWPVQAWVVTDGPRPAWHASAEGVGSVAPPATPEISATGSGDVLFAALLATWFWPRGSLAEALAMALPLASLNAASPGVADFPLPANFIRFATGGETA